MILDSLFNLKKYSNIISNYNKIPSNIVSEEIKLMTVGKYKINKNDVYLLIQEYSTENSDNKLWESHRKYIDIHIVLSGVEKVYYSPSDWLTGGHGYDENSDAEVFDAKQKGISFDLRELYFCAFFPDEAHKPGCIVDESKKIKKCVIKLLV